MSIALKWFAFQPDWPPHPPPPPPLPKEPDWTEAVVPGYTGIVREPPDYQDAVIAALWETWMEP